MLRKWMKPFYSYQGTGPALLQLHICLFYLIIIHTIDTLCICFDSQQLFRLMFFFNTIAKCLWVEERHLGIYFWQFFKIMIFPVLLFQNNLIINASIYKLFDAFVGYLKNHIKCRLDFEKSFPRSWDCNFWKLRVMS